MRLRYRPWKLLAAVVLGMVAVVTLSIDVLDGAVSLRRWGQISVWENPSHFAAIVVCLLIAWGFIMLGWMALLDEWNRDYRSPLKPRFKDPERERRS